MTATGMTQTDQWDRQQNDEQRERVARALFVRRGFRDAAWDYDTAWANGMRRDCRYLAEAAIAAMNDASG